MDEIVSVQPPDTYTISCIVQIKCGGTVGSFVITNIQPDDKCVSRITMLSGTELRIKYDDFSTRVLTLDAKDNNLHDTEQRTYPIYPVTPLTHMPLVLRSKQSQIIGKNPNRTTSVIHEERILHFDFPPDDNTERYLVYTDTKQYWLYTLDNINCQYTGTQVYAQCLSGLPRMKGFMQVLHTNITYRSYGFRFMYCVGDAVICVFLDHPTDKSIVYRKMNTSSVHFIAKHVGDSVQILVPTPDYQIRNVENGEIEPILNPVSRANQYDIQEQIESSEREPFFLIHDEMRDGALRLTYANEQDQQLTFIYKGADPSNMYLVEVWS